MALLGGWDIKELKYCNLPQKVQTAFTSVTSELVGADYEPVLYVGSQLVNGTNYCVIAKQTLITASPEYYLVKIIINVELDGTAKLVSISRLAI